MGRLPLGIFRDSQRPWSVLHRGMGRTHRHNEGTFPQVRRQEERGDGGGQGPPGGVTKMERAEKPRVELGHSNSSHMPGGLDRIPEATGKVIRGASKQEKDTLDLCFQNMS